MTFGHHEVEQHGLDPSDIVAAAAADEVVDAAAEGPSPRFAVDARRVVLRIHGDEDIVVGRAGGREPAIDLAREMVRRIEQASARGEWPQIEERFVRPGAIVSVDVQRGE